MPLLVQLQNLIQHLHNKHAYVKVLFDKEPERKEILKGLEDAIKKQ